ncbi:hypothetical protein ACFSTC_32590 [Nonomuraea ferruginea]
MRRRDLLKLGGLAALGTTAAACGGDQERASRTQLQFMFWGSTFEKKAVENMLKQYEQKNPGVTVKPLYTPPTSTT